MNVLLVDDHPVVLKGLRFFLQTRPNIHIVGEAQNGEEALQQVEKCQPDVVLMDVLMPNMDGIEATRRIKEKHPHVQVIILTSSSDKDHVLPAIRAGASGYQLKDVDPRLLEETLNAVMSGETSLHPQISNQLMTHVARGEEQHSSYHDLTPRERIILEHITHGQSNKEIAAELHITEKTVKTHITNILGKMGVQDRTQAAIHALKHHWFEG
ncbi:two component transcriptional regulator, LuxR family [Melghirimyces thermohalophilus]|uniref:Two component transcriptional regulator, LuxR family n=1 Tax=Melghirimyces thermohalophilus TaxID=1236220 RepID=A0A1G6KR02_9BACL|nr:response regulator transcription factor [Melghirimyces thermohalophilus]SDC32756.1 two component transcriptional regulator, LuxR family [Melghirimyces thermohalophilus]